MRRNKTKIRDEKEKRKMDKQNTRKIDKEINEKNVNNGAKRQER